MRIRILFTLSLFCCLAKAEGLSKVLVALGYDAGYIRDVEIVDLLSSETICHKPENFPDANAVASGGLGFQDKPLICGGFGERAACHLYEDGTWKISDSLVQGRSNFEMTKSPFQDGSSKLFLTGGNTNNQPYLNSSEVLTENGWQESVPLPVNIAAHCMVTVNSSSVMVIGGKHGEAFGDMSGRTFLFNSETNVWTEGPTLIQARTSHSCGLIRKNSQTEVKSLIAVGGKEERSVEVLDLDSNTWRRGPDLPFALSQAALVEDPSGGVVLIGGYADDIYFHSLYRLSDAGSDATWELMPQKLRTRRGSHTAFLIPDDIAACN